MFNEEESKKIDQWKSKEISKINESRLSDDAKEKRIEIVKNTEFHKLQPMKVKEVSPHHFEAVL